MYADHAGDVESCQAQLQQRELDKYGGRYALAGEEDGGRYAPASTRPDQSTGSYRLVIDWAIDPNFRPGELDRSEQLTRRTERIRTTSTGWTVSNVRIDWTSLTAINLVGMFGNAKWNTCMPIVAGRNGSLLVQLTTRALLAAAGAWWAPPLRCCFFYHQPPSSRVGRVCASQVPWERA